jgi:hypothetical protein
VALSDESLPLLVADCPEDARPAIAVTRVVLGFVVIEVDRRLVACQGGVASDDLAAELAARVAMPPQRPMDGKIAGYCRAVGGDEAEVEVELGDASICGLMELDVPSDNRGLDG